MYPARPIIVRKKFACAPVTRAINGRENMQEATQIMDLVIKDLVSNLSDNIPPAIFEVKPRMVMIAALIIAYSALYPGYD